LEKKIYVVDAFSEVHFGGNPAGVVLDAIGLKDEQMLQIANEINLSETAFIFPSEDDKADYKLRFFTKTEEIDLCGHATVAAFYVLGSKGLIEGDNYIKVVRQNTRAGILPVELYFKNNGIEKIMMTQAKPNFGSKIEVTEHLAKIMGLNIKDIGIEKFNATPQIVSTGLKDIILPVKSLKALKGITPNYQRLKEYSDKLGVIGVHAFSLETEEQDSTVSCRNFAPLVGIDEEAATGTSNGALGAYLVSNQIVNFKNKITIMSEQGYYMNRRSKIIVIIEGNKENYVVKVGGTAAIVIEGKITL
jgi:trans-2,3-dihydro-3-hydroxyanthranilate isomerase